jgi:hypothetical protein
LFENSTLRVDREILLDRKTVFARRAVREPHDERGPARFATEQQQFPAGNNFRGQDFRVADGDALYSLVETPAGDTAT